MDCVKECVKKCGSVKKCANDILERAKCLVKECVKNIRARAGTIVFGVVYFIIVGFFLALQASMVVMGATYIDECPREKYIQIYLIVGGSTSIVLQLLMILLPSICFWELKYVTKFFAGEAVIIFCIVLCIFYCIWNFAGLTWIDGIKDNFTVDDRTQPTYCSPTLYDYARWMVFVNWFLIGLCYPCLTGFLRLDATRGGGGYPCLTGSLRPGATRGGGPSERGPSDLPCTDIDNHHI